MKYRILKFLLLTMAVVCSISARGTTQITYGDIAYSIDEATKTAIVARQNGNSQGSVTIPSTIYYDGLSYTVTAVGDYAFYNCRSLISVSLPSTITSIGDDGFGGCSELTTINIPEGVTSIGRDAFYYCLKLASVTLPSTLRTIGQWAFENCSALTEITIPNGVKVIASSTFDDCSNLQKVTLPTTITSIGSRAFWYCSKLQSINLPDGITSIGSAAFSWCQELNDITLPSKLQKIEESAFSCCKKLSSIVFPDNVRSIESNAFGACSSLQSIIISKGVTYISPTAFSSCKLTSITVADGNPVYDSRNACNAIIETATNRLLLGTGSTVIPDGITEIGAQAFYNCYGLTSINIPSSVRVIGDEAFSSCYDLQQITVGSGLQEIGARAFNWCNKLSSFEIPKSVHYIGEQAFQSCQAFQSFVWPEALSNISDGVLQNCGNLTSVTIPTTVKRIGKSSFMGCRKLTSISIPSSVTTIDDQAFSGCELMTSFEVPATVTKLGTGVWDNCPKLTSLTVSADNPVYDSREECNAIIETESNRLVISTANTTVPSTVTAIGDYAFQNSNIESLTLPSGLRSIGKNAFSSCSKLTAMTFPEGLQSIGESAFFGSSLESITLPATMKEINSYVFWASYNLKTVVIPANIEKVGSWAFLSCRNLTDVYCYRATPPVFGSRAFETFTGTLHVPAAAVEAYKADVNWGKFANIVAINEGTGISYTYDPATLTATLVGYNNRNNSQLILHSKTLYSGQTYKVAHIGANVFENHTEIQSIQLPDSLTTLGSNALSSCTALRKITLPASLSSVGADALSSCGKLTDIYCFATAVPTTGGGIVSDNYLSKVTLHVPSNLISQYKEHEEWGKFTNIVPLEAVGKPTSYLEYFIDHDPGLGKGYKSVIGKTEGEYSLTFYEEDSGGSLLHSGINNIGMRIVTVYDDGTTFYSPTIIKQVYKPSSYYRGITYVEYFWDEDPGYGKGTPLEVKWGIEETDINAVIDKGNLAGEHTLFVRAQAGNVWSLIEARTVILPAGILSGDITLDPDVEEDAAGGVFNMLSTLLSALSTRGFDIGLNVSVADATYNLQISEQAVAVIQALYQYFVSTNYYISMKAQHSATFNFVVPTDFIMAHMSEIPQIVAAVQAMFSHIVTENITILINGQTYKYNGFQVEPNDLLALKTLYNRLGGDEWTQKKWTFASNGRNKAEMPGVEFNDAGRVTSIDLYNNNLKGELDTDWELNLPYLTYLNLSQNNIEGDLSPFLRYCSSLKSLYMSNNCLTEISDTLPGSLQTIDLQYQFKKSFSNSELKDSYLAQQQPVRFFISNSQTLALPSLFTYNHKYKDHSSTPTVYLLDSTSNHNSFAYYTSQYGFAWKSGSEYTDVQDARYLAEISGGSLNINGSVIPMCVRYVEGDANMTGATDVLDVQHTLNRILGTASPFNRSAANTYADEVINVQDIVCTVNIVLNQQNTRARSLNRAQATDTQAWLYAADGQLRLASTVEVGAIDVELRGVNTSQVSLLLNHSRFQMIGRNTAEGSRYVIFSPTGEMIPAGEVTALLKLSAQAEVVAVQAADSLAEEMSITVGQEPTGIAQLMDGTLAARFQGNRLIVKANRQTEGLTLRLTSTGGAVVYSTVLTQPLRGETALTVNIAPGVYLLEMTTADGARKIVKLMKR